MNEMVDCLVCRRYHPFNDIPHGILFEVWVNGRRSYPWVANSEFDILREEFGSYYNMGTYEVKFEWKENSLRKESVRKIVIERITRVGVETDQDMVWLS